MAEDLLVEKADGVAWVTFNRPKVRNALTFAMCRTLTDFFESLATDEAIRAVVLRGSGSDFSSGADLREVSMTLAPTPEERRATAESQVRALAWPLLQALARVPQPVLASVRGHAIGVGAQFAFAADLVIAGRSARFTIPQVKLGHSADHGESWYLPRKVGAGRALQILLLGEPIEAHDAERFGIVNWLVDDNAVAGQTASLALKVAQGASVAIRESKSLVYRALEHTLDQQLEAEAKSLGRCAATTDYVEAIEAFVAKRRPAFTGR